MGELGKGETVSNVTEAPRPSLLSDQSLSVVQATASVVAAHADEITAHFYPRMFAAQPGLLSVFNQGTRPPASRASVGRLGCHVRDATDRSEGAVI